MLKRLLPSCPGREPDGSGPSSGAALWQRGWQLRLRPAELALTPRQQPGCASSSSRLRSGKRPWERPLWMPGWPLQQWHSPPSHTGQLQQPDGATAGCKPGRPRSSTQQHRKHSSNRFRQRYHHSSGHLRQRHCHSSSRSSSLRQRCHHSSFSSPACRHHSMEVRSLLAARCFSLVHTLQQQHGSRCFTFSRCTWHSCKPGAYCCQVLSGRQQCTAGPPQQQRP